LSAGSRDVIGGRKPTATLNFPGVARCATRGLLPRGLDEVVDEAEAARIEARNAARLLYNPVAKSPASRST
jgi:hypothetical protein